MRTILLLLLFLCMYCAHAQPPINIKNGQVESINDGKTDAQQENLRGKPQWVKEKKILTDSTDAPIRVHSSRCVQFDKAGYILREELYWDTALIRSISARSVNTYDKGGRIVSIYRYDLDSGNPRSIDTLIYATSGGLQRWIKKDFFRILKKNIFSTRSGAKYPAATICIWVNSFTIMTEADASVKS